jgi:hypothetical protein
VLKSVLVVERNINTWGVTELEDGFHPQIPEEEAGRQPTRRQALARLALRPSKDDEDP